MADKITYEDSLDVEDIEIEGAGTDDEVYRIPGRTLTAIAIIIATVICCMVITRFAAGRAVNTKEIVGLQLLE